MNNTLIKGLGLLEVLAHSDRPMGVTELATRIGIGKSNVHRLLQALVALGYVRRDADTGAYAASIRLWELGSAVLANLDLRRVSQSWMEWLLERTRETVHLSVLDGDEVVYVHKLDSPEPVRAYSQVGGRAPAHCVATGKAMLAWVGEPQLAAFATRLHAHSPRTVTAPAEFLREMERSPAAGLCGQPRRMARERRRRGRARTRAGRPGRGRGRHLRPDRAAAPLDAQGARRRGAAGGSRRHRRTRRNGPAARGRERRQAAPRGLTRRPRPDRFHRRLVSA